MLLQYSILATSASIDSLGVGITYGIRNTKVGIAGKIIIFTLLMIITCLGVFLGNTISKLLPSYITDYIGVFLLVSIGIWILCQALKNPQETCNEEKHHKRKIYRLFLKSLGITISIIRNPISSDLDGSKNIDYVEAIYLGLAVSIDALSVAITGSIMGFTSIVFPIFISIFHLVFLSFGVFLGKKLTSISSIPENTWSIISAILLILLGISRLFI